MSGVLIEEYELLGDPRYRSYVSAIDKALKSFEYTSEWADLISALGKLNKVLLNHMKYPVIPRRITISKRLAQCMHPALPSGVHLKALETYDIIFKSIGPARLSQELFIYSAGLFPLLGHAAMNVKPSLLTVYETHFIPLGEKLRPGLNGFLIGVLPGLEEGSDYYDRTDKLLEKVCEEVERSYFYGCMWKCILSNPNVRLSALIYIMSHFKKKLSMEDQLHIIGTHIDTMVQGLCASLQDNSVLVQRSALDLLLLGFPIHNNQLVTSDMIRIVTAAVTVVLRRDMSLNRRLFSWLMVGESLTVSEEQMNKNSAATDIELNKVETYFNTYSKDYLLQALQLCFDNPKTVMSIGSAPSGSPELWCYRLLISLLDRPEISRVVLDDILIDVFRSLYLECNEKNKVLSPLRPDKRNAKLLDKDNSEIIKGANLLFGTLEPCYLWSYCGKLFETSCKFPCAPEKRKLTETNEQIQKIGSGLPSVSELCTLINFLLDVVSLETYLEARTEHLPELLCHIANALSENCYTIETSDIAYTLKVCSKILSKAQPPVINLGSNADTLDLNSCDFLGDAKTDSSKKDAQSSSLRVDSIVGENDFSQEILSDILLHRLSYDNTENIARSAPDQNISDANSHAISRNLITAITRCVEKYQVLFVTFLKSKVLKDIEKSFQNFEKLLVPEVAGCQGKRKLEDLIQKFLDAKSLEDYNMNSHFHQSDRIELTICYAEVLSHLKSEIICDDSFLKEAFQRLCHLLVELSSFPTFCTNSKGQFSDNLMKTGSFVLPEWLKLLTIAACFIGNEDFFFSAMNTLFDLIALTKSVAINHETNLSQAPQTPTFETNHSSVVSVVIIPVLSMNQISYLSERTLLFTVAAIKLWGYVGDTRNNLSMRSTELLQQVHNLSPMSSRCEEVICNSMQSADEFEQVQSLKKFCKLWHLTRHLSLKGTLSMMTKAFDRCLFLMLDNLCKETGPQKAIAQSWLNHSLQRGDVARILEPILMILLHPDSARVSVQHISVHGPRKLNDIGNQHHENFEAKIYAISSVSGNIIYHVSDESHPSSQQGSPERKIFALTSVVDSEGNKGSKIVTQNSMLKDIELPSSHERDLHLPISVFVNPFGSLSSFGSEQNLDCINTPDLSQARRIDSVRKSSFDDDSCDAGIFPTEEPVNSETIAKEIVNHIISMSVTEALSKECDDDIFMESDMQSSEDSGINRILPRQDTSQLQELVLPELTVHPLHTYILLYCQVFDSQKTLYALYSLKAIVLTNPRTTLCNMATTNISNSLNLRGQQLQVLLARHRKSVFGKNFHGELGAEATTIFRSNTFVEVIVSACLYHIRSYYPNLPQVRLTDDEIMGNRNVRLLCMEVLTLVFSELVGIVKDSGKSFASYLSDLLQRCKVQKILLHCLVANVYDSQRVAVKEKDVTFTETIVEFNDRPLKTDKKFKEKYNDFQDTFQIHLLRLIATLIVLEDTVTLQAAIDRDSRNVLLPKFSDISERTSRIRFQSSITSSKYQQGVPIPSQSMFLSAILSALCNRHQTHLHNHWLSLVTSALPFAGRSLTRLVITVASQLCNNLESVASFSFSPSIERNVLSEHHHTRECLSSQPDYLIILIEGLTTLCHYCLLDCPAPVSTILNQSPLPPAPSQPYAPGTSASQIISNLIHVFSTSSGAKDSLCDREPGNTVDPIFSARHTLLSNMPRIIASLSAVFEIIDAVDKGHSDRVWIIGTPKIIKQHILSFLSPISLNYSSNFMAAIAVVWHESKGKSESHAKKIIAPWSSKQQLLVQLVAAIKVLPFESLVSTVRVVLKQPPSMSQKDQVPLDVNILQFFLAYIQHTSGIQLIESWQSLLGLWKDGLNSLSPPVHFHLFAILHEFAQRAPIMEDKKAQKDLQEITHKLIEACSTVACSSLEQTTWLWRNLAVRPGPQMDISISETQTENDELAGQNRSPDDLPTDSSVYISNSQYSVQALCVLAEFLAPVLDFVYVGEEKEKVVPLLSNIMYYVTPYLKNHRSHNIPSFRSCCQLLSNISGYQHTRKSWRKDAFDLLLDCSFFQMEADCINYWRAIIDHLMTHDKTTFRDFMARVSVSQSGSLNLFSSKEQEYEQRAHILKRLAFVIFCSEIDQYQRYIPEIQERLTENLRFPHIPVVQAQVFLCFRVLLVRMSSHHVTSLWPVIITEMVQVFTQIEHELCTDSEEFRKIPSSHLRRLSTLDSSWVVSTNSGLNAHNNPAWLCLYLSVCKLLDMCVALPANMLPQFQMYRWAFVRDSPPLSTESSTEEGSKPKQPEFTPHIVRLAKLLNEKVPSSDCFQLTPGQLLLTTPVIKSLLQLQPFFNTMSDVSRNQEFCQETQQFDSENTEKKPSVLSKSRSAPELYSLFHTSSILLSQGSNSILEQIENVLVADFLEFTVDS